MKQKRKYTKLPCRKCISLPMCMSLYHEWYIARNLYDGNGKRNKEFKDVSWLLIKLSRKCNLIDTYLNIPYNQLNIKKYYGMKMKRYNRLFDFFDSNFDENI